MNKPSFTLGGNGAAADDGLVKDATTQSFRADVLDESRRQPVLVDFWAPWCGPCKQLGPVLEKAVKAAKGKVKLVKLNTDEHQAIAGQIMGALGIQSIPAVIAFKNGQPVDGFIGALPESQVKAFVERVVGPIGPSDAEAILAEAEAALAENDLEGAGALFAEALRLEPENAAAIGGLARVLVMAGEVDHAREVLGTVPKGKENDPAVAAARAQLDLAQQVQDLGDARELKARVEADPNDHQARFDFALALNARGDRQGALDNLLEIVRRDRAWNEDAARKQLVQLFDAWGPKDPLTAAGRRRLSSLLFA
jgi:putative thioredoxin